ncbi:MAG: alpha-mannosidase [bacterium]
MTKSIGLAEEALRIDEALRGKIARLRGASEIPQWKFHLGKVEGAEGVDFDDEGWESVKLLKTWSSAVSEAWFRGRLSPPEEVEGISLADSTVELVVMMTIGAAIYLDGREVYREQSWVDTRAIPLVLVERFRPGTKLTVAVRAKQGDGFGLFLSAALRFGNLAPAIFDLDLFRQQMAFTRYLMDKSGDRRWERAWREAAGRVDLRALEANRWDRWNESVRRAREALAPFAEEAKKYTAYLIAHSHIDMNWLWTWEETVDVCRRDFTIADQLMERYPEFHFSQSQVSTYKAMEDYHPEVFSAIRRRVEEGRWDVTANTWVEGDLNMSCGESLVRQILLARRYIKERFGLSTRICWEPDTFGHPATYPQILKKSGIEYYYFCRAGKGHPLFWWEGLDGSRVLAFNDLRGYGGEITPQAVVESVMDVEGRYKIPSGMFVYGVGDHGGGGTARDIESALACDRAPYVPRARLSDTASFYDGVRGRAANLPVVRGELNTVFEGCYTSHGDIKSMNRRGENRLLTAEVLATLASLRAGYEYPIEKFREAWQNHCFHQFHDILCGCAIGATYREAANRLAPTMAAVDEIINSSLSRLASEADTGKGRGRRIVVFNPLAWERIDVVRIPLAELGGREWGCVEDDGGTRHPVQIVGDSLVFVAEGVPPLGFRVFRPLEGPAGDSGDRDVKVSGDNTLENEYMSIHIHPASGAIDRLVDKEVGRDIAGPWAGWGPEAKVNAGMLNRLQILYEQPHPMSAWNIGDITRVDHLIAGAEVETVASGPVCGIVQVKRRFLNSSMTQRIILYRRMRRVDFETEVEWHEVGSAGTDAPMLRTTFSPFFGKTTATFEVPFAGLERPADGREVPALRWADLSEEGYGLSLLNDGKYGHQAHGNTLGLTLVRASYEPDNNPDEGLHKFTYSIYPHPGTWRDAGSDRKAVELNQPLLAKVEGAHSGVLRPGEAPLVCEPPNVLVSAVKYAEDQADGARSLIVRLYENHGHPTVAHMRCAWDMGGAEEVDLMEQSIKPLNIVGGEIELKLGGYEIKTVKLRLR